MSALPRLLRQFAVSRRGYSSFFSSKPGGGRYFNSAKSPKSAVVTSNNSKIDLTTNKGSPTERSDGGSENANIRERTQLVTTTESEVAPTPSSDVSPRSSPHSQSTVQHLATPLHPVVNPKDFNLHQFLSLHRPLLLLSNPSTILQTAPQAGPLFVTNDPKVEQSLPPCPPIGPYGMVLGDHGDLSIDADAETARQLTRALTMSRAGGAVAWEETLRRVGLDAGMNANVQLQMEQHWKDVLMDSTKRKRRKKMKKHKLKKRRKATRASRMKIGR